MPLLKPQEVVSYVIGDERIHDHLRRSEAERARIGFRDYVAKFGIHDLGEVSENQMFALVAARNTAPVIDLLRIPCGKELSAASAYSNYDLHRRKTSLGPAIHSFLASAPNTDQEWEVLRDPEDIPEAIPEDLLLRRLAPREFVRRLAEGELLRSAWVQEDFDELLHNPIEVPEESSRMDQTSAAEDARPFGYLLLDASESMGSGRDRRDEVARGLGLAYLLSQFEAGNPTILHLFRHELSPVFGGETRFEFEAAAAAVLAHSHQGMTNLQGAMRLLADVMRTRHKRVDIALITDGVTRLTESPLGDAHLHTFLLGVRPEEFDKIGGAQYQESFLKLQSWSDFLFRIDPGAMANASVPRREDVLDFAKVLYGLESEIAAAASPDKVRRVQARIKNLVRFFTRYREFHGTSDGEIERLWGEVQEASRTFGEADPVEICMKNAMRWSPVDRDLTLSLENRSLRSNLDASSLEMKWKLETSPDRFISPWEALMLLWKTVKSKLRVRALRTRVKKVVRRLGLTRNNK